MDENEIKAFLDALVQGGLAEDQQALLEHQMAQAQKLRATQQPGMTSAHTMFGEQLLAPSPLANIAATIAQIKGGHQMNAILGSTPIDPTTGQPISMYRNLATSQNGVRAQLQQKITEFLRNRSAKVPTAPSAASTPTGVDVYTNPDTWMK